MRQKTKTQETRTHNPTATLEWIAYAQVAGEYLEDQAAAELAEQFEQFAAIIGQTEDGWDMTFSVEGDDLQEATYQALDIAHKTGATLLGSIEVRRADLPEQIDPELVGVSEAAELLRVSKQRVSELFKAGRLPKPRAELAAGPVWTDDQIRAFDRGWSRTPGRPPVIKGKKAAGRRPPPSRRAAG